MMPLAREVFGQRRLRAPTARQFAEFLDHEPADLRAGAFVVGLVDAVVADERIGHGHDLPVVRRIGEHFLVAGHGGVETHLADARAARAEGFALEHAAIFENQQSFHRQNEDEGRKATDERTNAEQPRVFFILPSFPHPRGKSFYPTCAVRAFPVPFMETAGDHWRNGLTSNEGLSFTSANQAPLVARLSVRENAPSSRTPQGKSVAGAPIVPGRRPKIFAVKEPSLVRPRIGRGCSLFPELETAEIPLQRGLQPGVGRVDFLGLESAIFGPVCQRISERLFVRGDFFALVVGEHVEEFHRRQQRLACPAQRRRRSRRAPARGPPRRRGRASRSGNAPAA